ncbi:MAG: hypothetical protein AB8B50_06300 [Pirellulaceae bacterium]
MTTFLAYAIILLGCATIFTALVLGSVYFLWVRRLSQKLQDSIHAMDHLISNNQDWTEKRRTHRIDFNPLVPPMTIFLEEAKNQISLFGKVGRVAERWLLENGFRFEGQFLIEELGYEQLRCYVAQDRNMLVSVRIPPYAEEAYIEFCMDLGEGAVAGIANPPASTLSPPGEATSQFLPGSVAEDPSLLPRMYHIAAELVEREDVHPFAFGRSAIADFYESAHGSEMLRRLEAGGISKEEVLQTLKTQGWVGSEAEVRGLRGQWQQAIDAHLLEFSPNGLNHQHSGQRVLIVHDSSLVEHIEDTLREVLESLAPSSPSTAREVLGSELEELFERFTPREAIARFRALLPNTARYQLIDQISNPIEADVYALVRQSNGTL